MQALLSDLLRFDLPLLGDAAQLLRGSTDRVEHCRNDHERTPPLPLRHRPPGRVRPAAGARRTGSACWLCARDRRLADLGRRTALLVAICQELALRSVLTTAVINWARSSVRELNLAHRLVHHAVVRRTLPKHIESRLIMLRDVKVEQFGLQNLAELQRRIRDPNWRIFAENSLIYYAGEEVFLMLSHTNPKRQRGIHPGPLADASG